MKEEGDLAWKECHFQVTAVDAVCMYYKTDHYSTSFLAHTLSKRNKHKEII